MLGRHHDTNLRYLLATQLTGRRKSVSRCSLVCVLRVERRPKKVFLRRDLDKISVLSKLVKIPVFAPLARVYRVFLRLLRENDCTQLPLTPSQRPPQCLNTPENHRKCPKTPFFRHKKRLFRAIFRKSNARSHSNRQKNT